VRIEEFLCPIVIEVRSGQWRMSPDETYELMSENHASRTASQNVDHLPNEEGILFLYTDALSL